MNDTHTPPMGPNVRRFVRSAWLLLFAQLIAAVFAIGATGWAAFYVADLRAERDDLRAQIEEFTGGTIIDPVRDVPMDYTVETVDDPAVVVEPDMIDEEPPIVPTPPPLPPRTDRPSVNRAPDVAVQRPATVTPRPRPTQPAPPQTERPAPTAPIPPRRSNNYPGGLPGDSTTNAEPPFVPGRFNPNAPVGRTPVIPDIDLDDVVREPEGGANDQIITDDRGPNFQRLN